MSLHAFSQYDFSYFHASKQTAVYPACSTFQDQSSSTSGSLSVCLLLERWNWTDKAVRNTGETFGNAYSELFNESG